MTWKCPECETINGIDSEFCSQCNAANKWTPLQRLLISSADEYYNHLKEHNLGIQKIGIRSREREQVKAPESTREHPVYQIHWTLSLKSSLWDSDSFFIRERRDENPATWNNEDYKIIEYDNEQRLLTLRFTENESGFQSIHHSQLEIVSDLKFLIKNVEKWIRKNGQNLRIPKEPFAALIEDGAKQKPIVENILTHPVQYVWGPPGTGKTQHALLNAVKEVVTCGGQAAIFAPTNSAVENAVAPIIDNGICAKEEILRLGTPSHAFALKYPECCEETGVKKKVVQLSQQIQSWETQLKTSKMAKTAIIEIDNLLPKFQKLHELHDQLKSSLDYIERHKQKLNEFTSQKITLTEQAGEIQTELEGVQHSAEMSKAKLQKLYGTGFRAFLTGLKEAPSKEVLLQNTKQFADEVASLETEKNDLVKSISQFQIKKEAEEQLISRETGTSEQLSGNTTNLIQGLRIHTTSRENINQELRSISTTHWEKCASNLEEMKNKALARRLCGDEIERLETLVDRVQKEKQALDQNIQEQLDQKSIIAMTIDKYISLFLETPLRCAHMFVDEAGFASLAKTICLFTTGTPITLIGDHKQIPPICENRNNRLNRQTDQLWSLPAMHAPWLLSKENPKAAITGTIPDVSESYPEMYTLTTTYRFGHNLARLLDDMMYRCNLDSAAEEPLKITIKHVSASPARDKRINDEEALLAKELLCQRINEDAAIITPYKNFQVSEIKRLLPRELRDRVFTIHKAQGREWDTVIFSVVDDGKNLRGIWFTDFTNTSNDVDKLINTALSRAKKELIILCNQEYWSNRQDADKQLISRIIRIADES